MPLVSGRAMRHAWLSVFSLMVACLALMSPGIASAAHTSLVCPAKSGTVASGGTVSVNVTDCTPFGIGFAGTGPVDGPALPAHGSANLRITGANWFVDYSHNGDSATSDFFEFTDASGNGGGQETVRVTITISAPASPITVTPASLPAMTAGTSFSQTLSSSGGVGSYTYALQSGVLPVGLSLSSGGVLSGTPTQRGGYTFSVRSTDSKTPTAQFVDKGYTGTVANPSLTLTTGTGTAIQNVAFSQTLATSGGVAPYTYTLETGSFPAGISLSSGGVVSGTTAAAAGNYPVTIRVTDASTGPGSYFEVENYTLTVSPPPSVSIAVSPASVSEDGATNLTYTVTRSLNLSSPTVVNITTTGTATQGIDYTGNVATVTIPAGATTATITINPTVDGTVEPDETVTLTVAAGTGYTVGVPASATGTILNDDVPSVTISVSPASVAEDGAPNLVYTFTLNQAAFSATSINYTIGGTATNGTDYATIASPLVIPAGNTTGTVTVNPTADATIEADETVVLTLAAGTGYTVAIPNSATGTILNDDLPNLSINDVTLNEGNSGTTSFTFTVSLSAPAGPGGVTFNIATANGTATAGSDYVAQSLTSQTIPAGSSTYSFTVQVNGDTLAEATETFFVNVTGVTNAVVVDGQGVGTIANDDPLPSLSINDVTVTEGNSGTTSATFTVSLSSASGQTVTVNYASADGTATSGSDYTATSGVLTFVPGDTTKTVTVSVLGDTVPESNETFFVNLSGATNATISDSQGVGTINNDDVPVTVSPTTLGNGTVAVAYSQAISGSGGVAPYTYALTAGALPAGLTLSPGGVLSGTPTAGGTFNFTVSATDSSPFPGPFSGTQAYTLTVAPATISLASATFASATIGAAYSASLPAASGGTAPYSYVVTSGSLPPGLSLNAATGAITGTPSGPSTGAFNFNVTATDSSTGTGPYNTLQPYAITIIDVPPTASNSSLTVAFNAGATNVPLSLSGGAAVSLAIGTAPAHGTAIVSGTSITYQPTAGYAGPDSFTYTATNTGGTSSPATVSVTVNDPVITITPSAGFSATVASAYTQTFTFNGGSQPWSGFQVTNLPAGLSVTGTTSNSVTVSGTPTQAGSFNLNVSATDSSTGNGPYTVGQAFMLTVAGPTLSLTPAAGTLTAPYGTAYSQAFTASGGTGPYTYAQTGTLPAGLSFSGNTITGTPTVPGSYSITVTATDTGTTGTGAPFTVAQNYTVSVAAPSITVSGAMPNTTGGASYSQTVTGSGGVAPYTYSLAAGAFPPGLSLNTSTGTLSGTASTVGSFSYIIRATDANGQHGDSAVYTVTVAAPTLTMTPASGTLTAPYGAAYSQVFTASGGSGSFSYALTGSLPAGVSFSGNTLSGTPTAPGSYPVTVTATDTGVGGVGAPFTVSNNYTLNVPAPTITLTPASLPGTTGGASYSQTLTASGAVAPYSYAVTAGSLPPGLTLSAAGLISGTVTGAGTYNLTITATDAHGQTGSQAYALTVAAPTLALTPAAATLTSTYGSPYSQAFTASGGSGSFSYVLTGTLPAGLSFSGSTLSGTPTAPGSYSISVTATDTVLTGTGAPFSVGRNYTLNVPAPTITLTPSSLPGTSGGQSYSQTLTAGGGASPYTYAVTAGVVPGGMTLSSGGALSGTATTVGTFNFTVTATDTHGQTGSQAYTVTVAAPTLTLTPAAGTLTATYGSAYTQAFTASGGSGNFSYALTGALPSGVTFSAGTLSGTPTVPGSYPVTVTATDTGVAGTGAPFQVTHSYTLSVPSPAIALTPASLPNSTAGLSYTQSLTAGGGVAPYTYAVTAGAVPTGLSLSSSGALSGTLTASGTFNFTVTATDTYGQTGSQAYSVVVAVPTITLTPGSLPGVTAGTAYSQALTITGGIAPYTVTQTGSLPTGLSFNTATRTFSGTPTQSGSFNISVTVTDSTGGTAATVTNNYTLVVAVPTLSMTPATIPAATAGVAYSQTYVASGGIAPYSYSVSSGALPAGLTLNSASGALSGTPTVAGTFNFSVKATDSTTGTAATITNAYTLVLSAPTITVAPSTLPQSMQGVPFSVTLTASGGTAPYSFAVTTGSLPTGLSLAAGGALTGSPTVVGSSSFTVTATDALGFTGTVNYALVTAARPDPTQDKEVRGLMTAELESVRRLASAQINNFQQRLSRLHGATSSGYTSTLNLSYERYCPMADNQGNSPACSNTPVVQQLQNGAVPGGMEANVAGAAGVSSAASGSGSDKAPVGIWTAGSIRYAKRSPDSNNDSMSFRTDGVSMGADYRFGDDFVFGGGLGYGSSDTDVGSNGSRSSGDAVTVALYGSYNPDKLFFIDGMLGYQTLSYDQRRYVTSNGNFVTGSRDGDQWLASVSLGSDVQRGKYQLTPYLRFDVTKATLDGFTEQGDAVYGLSYGDLDSNTSSANAGFRVSMSQKVPWGVFIPQFTLEYQRDLKDKSHEDMQYADLLSSNVFRLDSIAYKDERVMTGVGLQFNVVEYYFSMGLDYRGTIGSDNDHSYQLNLEKRF